MDGSKVVVPDPSVQLEMRYWTPGQGTARHRHHNQLPACSIAQWNGMACVSRYSLSLTTQPQQKCLAITITNTNDPVNSLSLLCRVESHVVRQGRLFSSSGLSTTAGPAMGRLSRGPELRDQCHPPSFEGRSLKTVACDIYGRAFFLLVCDIYRVSIYFLSPCG